MIGVSNNSGRELNVGGCHEVCLAVFTHLESLSRSLFQCENRLYLFSTKVFSKAEIAKELRWRVLLLVRFLNISEFMEQQFLFIVMAIASRLYKWTTMSHLSTQAWEDGWTWLIDSQENFEYPNRIFSEHWQKTREGYCSVIKANSIIEIEAWLEKSAFRFKVEKFERRMNSNFEQENQILILGQNAWPGLTVKRPRALSATHQLAKPTHHQLEKVQAE